MDKIDELKKQYKDRSLSREERQKILCRIKEETYRTDTRKPISVRKNTLIKCIGSLLFSISCLSIAFLDFAENDVIAVIEFIPVFAAMGYGFYWLTMTASYKAEPDDELAVQNRNKAGNQAFFCTAASLFLVTELFFLVSGITVIPIEKINLMYIYFSVICLHSFFSNLIFLSLDGGFKDFSDEETAED